MDTIPSLRYKFFAILAFLFLTLQASADHIGIKTSDFHSNLINIRNVNGKFYAYIVLLYNENPHFVNLIQADSVSLKMMQKEGFNIIEYRNYCTSIIDPSLKKLAKKMLAIYLAPEKYDQRALQLFQDKLARRNIILRFSREKGGNPNKIFLDYCILGKKIPVRITHPLFNIREKIYNIHPLIYYDEFSTSNSTFYFDMIYINPEEVQNDYIIAKNILANQSVDSMFFVGARVSDDIKYCLKNAFTGVKSIRNEIWKMFEIHELTHKILNNRYNFYDQVIGEELALVSTIYSNPYLGLSVLYSYLDYNAINPHRIAAMNLIRFMANRLNKLELIENTSALRDLPTPLILKLSQDHFNSIIASLSK